MYMDTYMRTVVFVLVLVVMKLSPSGATLTALLLDTCEPEVSRYAASRPHRASAYIARSAT